MKNVLIISDNLFLIENMLRMIEDSQVQQLATFTVRCSMTNTSMQALGFAAVNVKLEESMLVKQFDLIISAHCKQIFPASLVQAVRCINIHPGFNPYNRGWFPQVFSIINKLPLGATIHEIDEHLDHGAIIAQQQVEVREDDTSLTAYNRVLQAELDLLREILVSIIMDDYEKVAPGEEGNLNLKKDFNELCKLDLEEIGSLSYFLDKLRALTHGEYKNAYFLNNEGDKVYVSIFLEKK